MTGSALPLRVTITGFGLFALIGAVTALYGPVIPVLIRTFALSEASGGLIMSAHFAGATAGIFAFGATARRFGYKALLLVSLGLLMAGCLGLANAPSWPFALGMTAALGLGYGGLAAGINELFAYGFGGRGTVMLSLVNAVFGIGATLGPLLLALTGATGFRGVLACALVGLPLLGLLLSQPNWQGEAQPRALAVTPRLNLGPVLLFVLVIFGYGLFESSVSA